MATADFEILLELRNISKKAAVASLPSDLPKSHRELEDRIAFFLFLLTRIDRVCNPSTQGSTSAPIEFNWERSRQVSELYTSWLDAVEATVSKISLLEVGDALPDGAAQLRECYRNVKLMSLDTDRVKRSIESLRDGRGIAFDSAMDQLRNNLR